MNFGRQIAHMNWLILLLAAASLPPSALLAQSAAGGGASAGSGTLLIFVPEGTGIKAWIYVDRKLVESPPAGDREGIAYRKNSCDGWQFSDKYGVSLTTHLGRYENLSSYNLGTVTGTSLFSRWSVRVPAGRHTVEAAFLWRGSQCHQMQYVPAGFFPFVFSAGQTVRATSGKDAQVYLVPPDGYDYGLPNPPAPYAMQAGCSLVQDGRPNEQSFNELETAFDQFEKDPKITALLRAVVSHRALPGGVVEVAFPPELGGVREFDGTQMSYLVDALVWSHPIWRAMPFPEQVAQCRQQFPQFAKTFAQYDQMSDFLHSQTDSIQNLQQSLDQNH